MEYKQYNYLLTKTEIELLFKLWILRQSFGKSILKRIQINSIKEKPSFKISVQSQFEKRVCEIVRTPNNKGTLETYDRETIDNISADDFTDDEFIYPIAGSERIEICENCDGRGKLKCNKCKGNGVLKCSRCNGSGKVTCTNCYGAGEVAEYGNGHKVVCPMCSYGKKTCSSCYGSRKVECDYCGGEGNITCSSCAGSGSFLIFKRVIIKFFTKSNILNLSMANVNNKLLDNVTGEEVYAERFLTIDEQISGDENIFSKPLKYYFKNVLEENNEGKLLFQEASSVMVPLNEISFNYGQNRSKMFVIGEERFVEGYKFFKLPLFLKQIIKQLFLFGVLGFFLKLLMNNTNIDIQPLIAKVNFININKSGGIYNNENILIVGILVAGWIVFITIRTIMKKKEIKKIRNTLIQRILSKAEDYYERSKQTTNAGKVEEAKKLFKKAINTIEKLMVINNLTNRKFNKQLKNKICNWRKEDEAAVE